MKKQEKPNILDEIWKLRNDELFGYDESEEEHDGFAEHEEAGIETIDLTKPPGLVGEVTEWINGQCLFPRDNLSVAAAISAVGNIGGLNHKLDGSRITSNIFMFGVAGSGTGKEDILSAATQLHMATGVGAAVHGTIKSEQEVIRNLIEHQASYYLIDEIGYFIKKVRSASDNGGASYLQNLIGVLMSVYSKARSSFLVSGDIKRGIRSDLKREFAALNKELDDGCENQAFVNQRLEAIKKSLDNVDHGIINPFLSLIGFTTPQTFNSFVDEENVTSGFIGRSIIINEPNNNPKKRTRIHSHEIPEELKHRIESLRTNGTFEVNNYRIESNNNHTIIKTDQDALQRLEEISEWFWQEAEKQTEKTGFEAVVRRGFEMVEKVSFILSFGMPRRTLKEINWAFEYIKRDIEYKTLLAYSNVKEKSDPVESMAAKILSSLSAEGLTIGRIVNKYRAKRDLVLKAIDFLDHKGKIRIEEKYHHGNKTAVKVIFRV